MAYWLIKTEPSTYNWDRFVKEGKTTWDGVRNYAARIHLKAMKKGDEAFFYHSNDGKEIVGIAKVTKEFYPDPTIDDPGWVAVDFKPVKPLKKSVSLAQMKANKQLVNMALIRIGRLSVSPVSDQEWNIIMEMSRA